MLMQHDVVMQAMLLLPCEPLTCERSCENSELWKGYPQLWDAQKHGIPRHGRLKWGEGDAEFARFGTLKWGCR